MWSGALITPLSMGCPTDAPAANNSATTSALPYVVERIGWGEDGRGLSMTLYRYKLR